MAKLTKTAFLAEMSGKAIDTTATDPRLGSLKVARADLDGDGQVAGAAEMGRLFKELDRYDWNGSRASIATTNWWGATTSAGRKLAGLRTLATDPIVSPPPQPTTGSGEPADYALRAAFPFGVTAGGTVSASSGSKKIRSVQYALGRLGFYTDLADGKWGKNTRAAIESFRASASQPAGTTLDATAFAKLDAAVSALDLRAPATKFANPLAYLSDFAARGLSPITLDDPQAKSWGHPEIRAEYGRFVAAYWPVMKSNQCEADCKTVALFFMDQFRSKLAEDTGVALPLPKSSRGGVPNKNWFAATSEKTGGFFTRTNNLPVVRPGYSAVGGVESLDPKHSMLRGVNLRYAGINANGVSRATEIVSPWHSSRDNHGDRGKPEVPVNSLVPGDMIFIDHKGDKKYDHAVNVVSVDHDSAGNARKLVLAVGSFDDMADADSSTPPAGLGSINNYCEEVTVHLAANGRITKSEVTWASEPAYLVRPRYGAHNTLMELKPGGTVFVGRWA